MVVSETLHEYWRWPETSWSAEDLRERKTQLITAGIDVGSVSTQAVLCADGELVAFANTRTGVNSAASAARAFEKVLSEGELTREDVKFLIGTGYGRVNIPFANRMITEITCHARGAVYIYGSSVRTVLDMGGQDCKAIRCDEKGKVEAFLMNDKCAAGTGRGMEVMADFLQVPVAELGPLSLAVTEDPPPVSTTCVVFAKSEVLGLLREGWDKPKVLAAYISAMAHRVVSLINRLGLVEDFAITGGISKNIGMVKRIEDGLGIKALQPKYDAQIAGALGAALFANGLAKRAR